jgi:muconolactone delta-isomerase
MKRVFLTALAAALVGFAAAGARGQQAASAGAAPATVNRPGAPADVADIIRRFTAKEAEFRKALAEYSFKRDAVIQSIAFGGQISGEYHRVSRFLIDEQGNRQEKILFFPIPTIATITVTPEDLEDLGGVNAFALESSKLHEYDFAYVGKERIDEIDTHVFDVTPKILADQRRLKELKKSKKPERFFQGRIWVDDRDLQIVKARGKGVPEFDQRFPTFETYRQQIDGKYWFPTYTYADDELVFKDGHTVRIRLRVKFEEFERLRGKLRIIEDSTPTEVKPEDEKEKPAAPPTKP